MFSKSAVIATLLSAVLLGGGIVGGVSTVAAQNTVFGQTVAVSVSCTPASVPVNQQTTCAATATTPNSNQTIVAFAFDFGDGAAITVPPSTAGATATATQTHTYTAAQFRLVTVTARDSSNLTGTAVAGVNVTVSGQAPVVTLSCSPLLVTVSQVVSCSVSASPANTGATLQYLEIAWGDNNSAFTAVSSGSTVTHTYASPGSFIVNAVAADSTNVFGQAATQVTVTPAGTAGQIGNVQIVTPPTNGLQGQSLNFNAATAIPSAAGATIQSYTWSFGDGATASGQTVSHVFQTAGNYTVTLTVTDSTGMRNTTSSTIVISSATPPPPPGGVTVTYPAGWDLVGGPAGTVETGSSGSLYTYQANDSNYEVLPAGTALQGGLGYWAQFASTTTVTLPLSTPVPMSIPLPASHFIMVSNPGVTQATVSGADYVFTYDPTLGYAQTTTLNPGQGAWVLSFYGGTLNITNVP